jgi:hypothetical protein
MLRLQQSLRQQGRTIEELPELRSQTIGTRIDISRGQEERCRKGKETGSTFDTEDKERRESQGTRETGETATASSKGKTQEVNPNLPFTPSK